MKKRIALNVLVVTVLILFSSGFSLAGNVASDTTKTKHSHIDHEMEKNKNSDQHQHGQNSEVKTIKKDDSIVRKGTINVESIDSNKDGKVYQDPMDWNVISDKPGKCPLCKMNLEEVSIKQAKENLKKNGFKVK